MDMALARVVSTKFKPGKRDEAIGIIDTAPKDKVEGFQGILALLPVDDPNSAILISFWDSEETLMASQKGIYQEVMKATENLREGPLDMKNHNVRKMKGQLIPVPA